MKIETIQTGWTLVSPAVPDRTTRRNPLAYTRIFQKKKDRIKVPVKCFYVEVSGHRVLIDAGWSRRVVSDPAGHLGRGLYFASEPVMSFREAAVHQLKGRRIDRILMTHLDCDHASGLQDFPKAKVQVSGAELLFARRKRLRYGNLIQGIRFRPFLFRGDESAPFGRSCDVFGDGSIIACLTPTHSAGSVIYKVTDGSQYALVVGDNGYMEKSWKNGILPGPLYDSENMVKCLKWINQCAKDENCLGIFCAHDPVLRSIE